VPGDGVIAGHILEGSDAMFDSIKATNLAAGRNGYFHYALLASEFEFQGAAGAAELSGNDLILAFPPCISWVEGVSYDNQFGNTLMHELGHNLGLRHGGSDDEHDKPNSNSLMNYRFSFSGIDTTCDAQGDDVPDYSHGTRIASTNRTSTSRKVCAAPPRSTGTPTAPSRSPSPATSTTTV